MGGFGSGRKGGYGTTDGALTLDLVQCVRLGQFRPGAHVQGTIAWVMSNDGRRIGSVSYSANMRDPKDAWVRLMYSTTHKGKAVDLDYRIELTTTVPHFGGVQWWFICPMSGHRVRCLHSVGHCERFAGRRFLRLGYKGQRETWSDQRLRAARVADAKLGGTGNLMDDPPAKPKWMRWPTYRYLVQQRDRASRKSMISALAAYDVPAARDLVDEAIRAEPDLLAGMKRR